MSQLLSGRNKGRFGAPPESGGKASPWRVVPLYVLVPLTAICLVVSVPTWLGYYACGERHESICTAGGALRSAETGTMSGIVTFTGVLFALAVVFTVVAALRVQKWPLLVVYPMAVLALVFVVYGFLALNGSTSTPAGTLSSLASLTRIG